MSDEPMPSKVAQALSLMKAGGKAVKHSLTTGRSFKTPPELQQKRLAICETCPFVKETAKGIKCTKCGCRLQSKTNVVTESCPIGKW